MPCYHPIKAYQAKPGAPLTFPKSGASNLKIPCNRCIGCRLERSKQTAIRLMHEAQLHERNSFITLTYNKQSLANARGEFEDSPPRARRRRVGEEGPTKERTASITLRSSREDSLSKRDAQLLLKRLRKALTKINPSARIKYYLVGEYGDKNGRPHFHAAIFGEDFSADRYAAGKSPSGEQLYRSPLLESVWTYGWSSIGDLTFQSAAYIARYVMKKIVGNRATEHYKRVDDEGQTYWITPEFALMSRGGRRGKGLANGWFQQYGNSLVHDDLVVMNGHPHKPPRYYDQLLKLLDQEGAALNRLERNFTFRSHAADNTPQRLRVREKVALARAKTLKRQLE